jgi:hypothetical protein
VIITPNAPALTYDLWVDSDAVAPAPNMYANIGGAWAPVSGGAAGDEIFIGPDDPGVASLYEMWYDTDDTSQGPPYSPLPTYANKAALDLWTPQNGSQAFTSDYGFVWLRRNNVWIDPYPRGWVASSAAWDGPTSGTTELRIAAISNVRLFAGRRYVVRFSNAAMYGNIVGDGWVVGYRLDGAALQGASVSTHVANIYFDLPMYFFQFQTTDGTHNFEACAYRTTGTGVLQFRGRMDILDEGPV